jgi:uncharacterized protein with PIN domain
MEKHRCPKCHAIARHLEKPSASARVDVYVCDKCDHLWTIKKQDPDEGGKAH